MSNAPRPSYKGRSLGIVTLIMAQSVIGFVHVFSGLWLLTASSLADSLVSAQSSVVYSVYTLTFGLLTLVFAVGIWLQKRWGWIGTIAVSIFVIVADALTLLNLPSIPGIPQSAAAAEIAYIIMIVLYLSQPRVRTRIK